jgi:hypothetical protein
MEARGRTTVRWIIAAIAAVGIAAAFVAGRATVAGGTPPVLPGPSGTVDGITVGFTRSRAGAEAAGAHYLLELERAMDTLDTARTASVASLIVTSTEARAITQHAADVIGLERAGGAPVRRVAISTDLVAYSPGAAQVIVLESWIYARAREEAVWAIERVSLAWSGTDWRVSAIDGASPSANESLDELRAQLSFPGPGDASVR